MGDDQLKIVDQFHRGWTFFLGWGGLVEVEAWMIFLY